MSLTAADLVARLTELPPEGITVEAVRDRLADGVLDADALSSFVDWREDKYARHLVHRCGLFDVLVLCWEPGQRTAIHNHSGQLGWVRLVSGTLQEETFRHPGGGPGPNPALVDVDDEGVGHGVVLEATGSGVVSEAGAVATVDRVRAIHRLGNPDPKERTITLHVYSRPHDSCLTFDTETDTCRRIDLAFDSVPDGMAVPDALEVGRTVPA